MILVLQNPINPGDLDKGGSYTHLHVEQIFFSSERWVVQITFRVGSLDHAQCFVPAKASLSQMQNVEGDNLDSFSMQMAGQNEPALVAAMRLSYQYLIDHCGYPGTIDPYLPKDPDTVSETAPPITPGDPAPSQPPSDAPSAPAGGS